MKGGNGMRKRIISLILLAVMLFSMIPTSLAADAEHTRVWRDLASMEFDGEPWNAGDFPAKTTDVGVYVIAVDEVGFRKDGNLAGYGFFLYLYNPSGQTFKLQGGNNTVQMAVSWNEDGTPKDYEKFNLTAISVSNEPGYGGVFMKMRVEDHASSVDGLTMKARLLKTKSRRVYDISGVELFRPDGVIKDYAYGCSVTVRGYDARHGDGNEASTKEITYTPATTLTLDVRHAYWRTQTSSKGANHKHQINSAYFTVPGDVWEQYKELYSIKCTWEEHHTTPMIVTDDQALYDDLKKFLFVNPENLVPAPAYHLYSNLVYHPQITLSYYTSNFTYNPIEFDRYDKDSITYDSKITRLAWLFKAKSEIELNKESVSAAEVLAYYEANKRMGEPLFLSDTVDAGREQWRNGMTIYLDTTFDLSNYDSTHNWFQKFIDYNPFNGGLTLKGFTVDTDEVYPDFEPITVFEPDNGNGQYMQSATADAHDVMKMYFFNDAYQAEDFMEYTQKALEQGDVVVLFRYASTDYFSESFSVYPKIDGHAYVATQTFFKNFDVIQLQFKNDDMSLSTVAVVNDPENFVGGSESPTTSNDPDLVWDQFMKDAQEWFSELQGILKLLLFAIMVCALIPVALWLLDLFMDVFAKDGRKPRSARSRGRQRGSTRRKK